MSDLDHLAISRVLGSTVQPYARVGFGGFTAVRATGEMLAARPKPPGRLAPEKARDQKIIQAFSSCHQGYSADRVLAEPSLAHRFIEQCQKLGVNEPAALINRRLLRLRKAGGFPIRTKVEDTRKLEPFLIAAELAFAQLTYRYDVSYDDLLADPEIG